MTLKTASQRVLFKSPCNDKHQVKDSPFDVIYLSNLTFQQMADNIVDPRRLYADGWAVTC